MNKRCKYLLVLTAIIGVLFFSSCINKDVGNIEESLIITPSYSVPLGSIDFLMDEVVGSYGFDTIPADTTLPPDSSFSYKEQIYILPPNAYYDTTYVEYFDFSNLEEWIDKATSIMFRLNMENTIPSEMTLQISFHDVDNNSMFVLFDNPGLLIPAATNNNSVVISPYDTDPLTREEILSLPEVQSIQAYVGLSIQNLTTGTLYYPDQFFNLQIGMRIALENNLGE